MSSLRFELRSPPFVEVLHRLRLDVFATAARTGVDMIFTNNSVWSGENARARFAAFADEVLRVVATNGAAMLFVQIVAPDAVLESRVGNESRRAHHKLVDAVRLRERLATHDATPLHAGDLIVDSSELSPAAAAERIVAELVRRS